MPSILSTRQAYQWINRIAQKHNQFMALPLSLEQAQALDRWVESDFVTALLGLEGIAVTPEDLMQATPSANAVDGPGNPAIAESLAAFRWLMAVASSQREKARLNVGMLVNLNAKIATGAFRQGLHAGSTLPPESLPMVVEQACRWFASGSISELNPVEQAALAFLRFVELAPFERRNEPTALLAASLLTMRKELPPIILKPHHLGDYRKALNEGMQMNTQPMVELVAGAVEQSLDEMIKWAIQVK